MGYRMNGFSGFGNSPAKQSTYEKVVSAETDMTKYENKLDGDKTSSKDDIIKFPDKEKTRSFTEKVEAGDVTVDGKNIHQIRKEKNEADRKEWVQEEENVGPFLPNLSREDVEKYRKERK